MLCVLHYRQRVEDDFAVTERTCFVQDSSDQLTTQPAAAQRRPDEESFHFSPIAIEASQADHAGRFALASRDQERAVGRSERSEWVVHLAPKALEGKVGPEPFLILCP